jgi:hypothetical protein
MNAPQMSEPMRDLYAAAESEQAARGRPQTAPLPSARKIRKPGLVVAMEIGHAMIPLTVWSVAAFRLVVRHAWPPAFGAIDWTFAISFLVQAWLFFAVNGVWTRVATRRSIPPPPGLTRAPNDVFWLTTIWSSLAWPTAFSVPILFWTAPPEMRSDQQMEAGLAILLLMLIVEGSLRLWVWSRKWFAP